VIHLVLETMLLSREMSIRLVTLIVLTGVIYAYPAVAQQPAPRAPIGPNAMVPPPDNPFNQTPSLPPLSPNQIRLKNIGNQSLYLVYWDGESAWRNISISSGSAADVQCAKCGSTVTVAFNNGKEDKSVKINMGSTYLLGWSSQEAVWILTPSGQNR
jgi:hypothetical protein